MNKSGWIRVDDRMPEKLVDVLVIIPRLGIYRGNLQYGITEDGKRVWNIDNIKCLMEYGPLEIPTVQVTGITHWMPLPPSPEPPEEKEMNNETTNRKTPVCPCGKEMVVSGSDDQFDRGTDSVTNCYVHKDGSPMGDECVDKRRNGWL